MNVHKIDNMTSKFPESLSKAQNSEINEKVIPINAKKATMFGLDVFQGFTLKHSTSQFHKRSRNCKSKFVQLFLQLEIKTEIIKNLIVDCKTILQNIIYLKSSFHWLMKKARY